MSIKVFLVSGPLLLSLAFPVLAQNSAPPPNSPIDAQQEPLATPYVLRQQVRMVTVDVVVEDSKGNHIHGLTADDFEVSEQTPKESRKKRVQKIVKITEIETAAMKPPAEAPAHLTPGVYSNAVSVQKDPVPPTVILVDGLNTEIQYQAQVHHQMLRMLKQLPPNVPVAVFLMGFRLTLLQGFTTDPLLLQKALDAASSPAGQGLKQLNPEDDPESAGNQMYGFEGTPAGGSVAGMILRAKEFDQMVYAAQTMVRFDRTYMAFLSLARSLQGYPGRKNILWLSTSFPLTLNLFQQVTNDRAYLNNWDRMKTLNSVLSAANVAVYPVDVGGVRTLETFSAGTRPANEYASDTTSIDGQRVAASAGREMDLMNNEQDTMRSIAAETGGKVCAGSNDLGKCIHDAMRDSSDFYEISYSPDTTNWNGQYRQIFVKVKEHGARLSYRHGYYATDDANPDPRVQQAQLQNDCNVVLDATGVAFTARKLPPDAKGRLNFSLEIDSSALTLTPISAREQNMDLLVGVCTFDKNGRSQNLLAYPYHLHLDEKASARLMTAGKLRDTIFVPGVPPAAVRVIVKDVPSGRVGSVYIPTAEPKEPNIATDRNETTSR